MKGYLYVADQEGREIPGSRRSLAEVSRGDGRYRAIENELKRLAGEDCTVRYSEMERRLGTLNSFAGYGLSVLFWGAVIASGALWLM